MPYLAYSPYGTWTVPIHPINDDDTVITPAHAKFATHMTLSSNVQDFMDRATRTISQLKRRVIGAESKIQSIENNMLHGIKNAARGLAPPYAILVLLIASVLGIKNTMKGVVIYLAISLVMTGQTAEARTLMGKPIPEDMSAFVGPELVQDQPRVRPVVKDHWNYRRRPNHESFSKIVSEIEQSPIQKVVKKVVK